MFENKDDLIKVVEVFTSKGSIKEWDKSAWFVKIVEGNKEILYSGVINTENYNTIEIIGILEALKKVNEQTIEGSYSRIQKVSRYLMNILIQ